jgi:hypothetical protein
MPKETGIHIGSEVLSVKVVGHIHQPDTLQKSVNRPHMKLADNSAFTNVSTINAVETPYRQTKRFCVATFVRPIL